jgi:hypothetical protein
MPSGKIPNEYAGAPGAKKSPKTQVYDLFKTFRHAPAATKEIPAEAPPAPKNQPEE